MTKISDLNPKEFDLYSLYFLDVTTRTGFILIVVISNVFFDQVLTVVSKHCIYVIYPLMHHFLPQYNQLECHLIL